MQHPDGEPKNILLVDSDEAFGQVLKQVLGNDHSLRQATSVRQALVDIESVTPDAILLNLDFSSEEGVKHEPKQLLHATSAHLPVPVIVYSWHSRDEKGRSAFREGAFDVLQQPLDVQQLKFVLDRACRRMELLIQSLGRYS